MTTFPFDEGEIGTSEERGEDYVAWIELHQSLPTHRKTIRLKKLLRIKTPQAIGHLCILWLWALDNAPDGDLSEFTADEIAEVSLWSGKDPEEFLDALVQVGFIDEDMHIHDWQDYAGKLLEQRSIQREQSRVRQQKRREKLRSSNADVTRDSSVSHAGVTHSPYPTVPNPTVPNPISSTRECKGECEGEVERGALPPPAGKKAKKIKRGQYGWVSLTDEEYQKLLRDLGEAELERCIAYIDESAQATANKNKWRDWNLVIRKCHREQWGIRGGGQTAPAQAAPKAGVGADMILAKFMQEGINS